MYHTLKKQIKSIKKIAILYIVVMFVMWGLDIAIPYLSGLYINYIVGEIQPNLFAAFVAAIAAASLLQMLFRYFQSIVSTKLCHRMAYQISSDAFQKIFRSDYQYYSNIDSAYYIDRISKDSNTVVRFFTSNVVNFFLQTATMIVSGIVVLKADTLLSVIIFSLLPFYAVTFAINKNKMYRAKAQAKQKSNEYFSRYAEQINKLPYIKRNVLDCEMEQRLRQSFQQTLEASLHSVRVDYVFMNLNQFVIIVAYLCIVAIGGYKVSTGELSIGDFSIINTYFNMMIRSVSYFLGLAGTYQDTKVSFERIRKIMDTPEEECGKQKTEKIHTVSVQDLTIRCENQLILNRCNFCFESGKIYGIRGQNGGGKTTLLNAMMGIFAGEHTGTVCYNGIPLSQLDLYRLRRENISYLEQDPVLLNLSVKDYLSFGIEADAQTQNRQREMIKMWGLESLLEKEMNENGSNFSGGEKQKLAMVRAFSKQSSLILLDEPTSALDKESIKMFLSFLQKRKQDAVIVLISHDPFVLSQCDVVADIFQIQS